MSEKQTASPARKRSYSEAFLNFIGSGWAPRPPDLTPRAQVATFAAARREKLSERYAGQRLILPAGGLKVRSNDTDYLFRPHSAFAHLTGLGADREPDAILVMEPHSEGSGHDAVLYVRDASGRDGREFFDDARYGEFWVGPRPQLADYEAELGLTARNLSEFPDAAVKDVGHLKIAVVRDADSDVTAAIDEARRAADIEVEEFTETDLALAHDLSTMRMVKDAWEIEQMRAAVAATHEGFEAIIAGLRDAVANRRGERWIEGLFGLHARHSGNGVGYDSICAAGDHATTLHWIKNTGEVRDGELILIDAGVEVNSLYTADITRTLPASGTFSATQRQIYDAVLAAQQAGMDAIRPGAQFGDVHQAAIAVIAQYLYDWGLLPDGVSVEDTLDPDTGGYHLRWMVHNTSHHLGIDVHDCALATREEYREGDLVPGTILTVEPGLYFKSDDLLVPERFRGIGIRIEDDVLVTVDGYENLSAAMPRTADDVEAWISTIQASTDH